MPRKPPRIEEAPLVYSSSEGETESDSEDDYRRRRSRRKSSRSSRRGDYEDDYSPRRNEIYLTPTEEEGGLSPQCFRTKPTSSAA